jgi:hypothetical protein
MLGEMFIKKFPVFVIVVLMLLPTLSFLCFPPQNVPNNDTESKPIWVILNIVENIGRIGMFLMPLFYSFNFGSRLNQLLLIVMAVLVCLYYFGWVKYFINGRDYALLFAPFYFIPIPLAVFPILYFFLSAILLRSYPLMITTFIFSIGHIPISYMTYLWCARHGR